MLTDGRQPFRLLQMEKRDKSERDLKREEVIGLVEEVHTAHRERPLILTGTTKILSIT